MLLSVINVVLAITVNGHVATASVKACPELMSANQKTFIFIYK